jgi:site-specific DNA-methyltransferase (adenine-specific)
MGGRGRVEITLMRLRPWRIPREILPPREIPPPRLIIAGRATLLCGDSREVLKTLADNSIDSIVTDPPYHLQSIHKRFAAKGRDEMSERYAAGPYGRTAKGFMGKQWDGGDIASRPEIWVECLRILKPGGHLLAFGGTRTQHRMVSAIEDVGFEIRDMVSWLYGTGFPKNHNVSNAAEWEGWGTALKPACEPICMARKPLSEGTVAANVLRWGTGAINIDGCRVASESRPLIGRRKDAGLDETRNTYGEGINGSECLGETTQGRFPANVITDGSDEVVAAFPITAPAKRANKGIDTGIQGGNFAAGEKGPRLEKMSGHDDAGGSAARFFYQAKATKQERAGSKHPTVKPISLKRYLCRMVTPPGGTVIDPFAGTGTTGEACHLEGFKVIMIEREAEYQDDIRRRMTALGVEL